MTDIATVPADSAPTAKPAYEGIRWLRRHLAWERTILDCVERGLDAQLADVVPVAPAAQSTTGTSAHNRSSS